MDGQGTAPVARTNNEECRPALGIQTMSVVQDMLCALLTHRPADAIGFVANYFAELAEEPSPLLRAYRCIRSRSERCRKQPGRFMDVLAVTYQDLSQAPGKSPPWVTTGEVIALLEAFCIDCPDEHVMLFRDAFKEEGRVRNPDKVSFTKYASFVQAAIAYNDFYGEAREWLQSSGCLLEGGDAVDVPSLLARVSQRASGHPRGRKDGGEAGTIESGTKWGTADLSWEHASLLHRATLHLRYPQGARGELEQTALSFLQLGRQVLRVLLDQHSQ